MIGFPLLLSVADPGRGLGERGGGGESKPPIKPVAVFH